MNNAPILIDSFIPLKSQTIYSIKRKSTLILNILKAIDKSPSFEIIENGGLDLIKSLSSIISPYKSSIHWIEVTGIYLNKKGLSKKTPISRGILLDILASHDGYPSWENFNYEQSNQQKEIKTFVLKQDKSLYDSLLGDCRVYLYWDQKNHPDNGVELENPYKKYNYLFPKGYAWGYSGSSVLELARAFLHSIDSNLAQHSTLITEAFLNYFFQKQTELILTDPEITQFIEHANQNPGAIHKRESFKPVIDLKDWFKDTSGFIID